MPEISQIRLSGLGGQGVILIGNLLGQAGMVEGKYASSSSAYGPQARGGWCKAEVVLSVAPIDFPHVIMADILVALSQNAYTMYHGEVKESGLIFYEKGLVTPKEDLKVRQIGIPARDYAVKELNNDQAANMVLLGALVEITGVVSIEAAREAIRANVSERFLEVNLNAFQAGMTLGRQING
jgi:2-oxoglutarate ferredoxin oxidoreductase subunit gamma